MAINPNGIYNTMKISVFIPTYNEEAILYRNIMKVNKFLSRNFKHYELVVVDDNSKDNTPTIVKNMKNKHIRYMVYPNGPSRRENLAEAMKTAKYPYVMYMDLDLAVPLNYILKLTKGMKDGNDIVTGSRRIKDSNVKRSFYRWCWSTLYHMTLHILYNSKIKDYQCGFKMFKKSTLLKILSIIGYDKTKRRGWFWDAETLLTAEKLEYKIKEIPVYWRAGQKSSFSLMRELKTVYYILSLKFKGVL